MSEQELLSKTSVELQEELEQAQRAVDDYEQEYKDICDTGLFARFGENAKAKKEEIAGAEGYVTEVKNALFRANQRETLSGLSQESLEALAMYYDSSNPDTPLTYTGQYAKEQVMTAFENQGIPANEDSFSQIYEYYRFAADEVRAMQKQTQWQADHAAASTLERGWMNVQTVLSAPARGISAATEMINAGLGYHDENAPLNIYDSAFDMTRFSTTVRSATNESIAEATGDNKVASFAYNTAMSIGDNAMNLVTMGGMGNGGPLASMTADAASQSAMSATLRGVSKEDALRTGVASGAIEMATEALPVNRLINIPSNSTLNSVRKGITEQAVIEGTEELISAGANTAADYIINQGNSSYSQNIAAYMAEGATKEEAVRMANGDVAADMVESALSGVVSGGTLSSGAYLVNGIATENNRSTLNMIDLVTLDTSTIVAEESMVEGVAESTGLEDAIMEALERDTSGGGDTVINGNYTQSADGVIHYKADQSVEARGWQGGDKYAGKDTYKNVTLEGSKEPVYLVKLKYSTSGYFMLKSEYDALKGEDGMVDSQLLSQGVQVAPWLNDTTKKYEYQSAVSIFKLEKDLDVALGEETFPNPQYGIGRMTQIYIAGYDAKNQANNDSIGLLNVGEEALKNSEITSKEFFAMKDINNQHIIKRDLFLQLTMKEKLSALMSNTIDPDTLLRYEALEKKLDVGIAKNSAALAKAVIKDKTILRSSTYDDMNAYLMKKLFANKNSRFVIQSQIEAKIEEVGNDLLRQIDDNLRKEPNMRGIKITEHLMNVYETDITCMVVQLMNGMEKLSLEEKKLVLEPELENLNDGIHQCLSLDMEILDIDGEYKLVLPDDRIDIGFEMKNAVNKWKEEYTR